MTQRTDVEKRRGFTLVELMIVVGIIALLITILIPVVGKIRKNARNTANKALLSQIERTIDAYYQDFHAYPGPLSNSEIWTDNAVAPPSSPVVAVTPWPASYEPDGLATIPKHITMSENLVLGLLGGLKWNATTSKLEYDPTLIGNGPASLNPAVSKRYNRYMDPINLSWRDADSSDTPPGPSPPNPPAKTGLFKDNVFAKDSIIPEFVDTDSDPLPILYLRAKIGAKQTVSASPPTITDNAIITYDSSNTKRVGQYDIHQIMGYTDATPAIGVGRDYPTQGLTIASLTNPAVEPGTSPIMNSYYYLRSSSFSSPATISTALANASAPRNDVPQRKDTYILIMAGPDRTYGTADDITNFGTPGQ